MPIPFVVWLKQEALEADESPNQIVQMNVESLDAVARKVAAGGMLGLTQLQVQASPANPSEMVVTAQRPMLVHSTAVLRITAIAWTLVAPPPFQPIPEPQPPAEALPEEAPMAEPMPQAADPDEAIPAKPRQRRN